MLDLLIAARDAAVLPEQMEMLEGILDGQDRSLRDALESEVDHSELFSDDFYWCFMGLAAEFGDASCWQVLSDYGYSMASQIHHPGDKPAESSRLLSLGGWVASWLPPERLKWLEEEGILDPWPKTALSVGYGLRKEPLSSAEIGLLQGGREQFDYWMDRWEAHEKKTLENKRLRFPSCGFHLPTVATVFLGMARWESDAGKEVAYPGHFPATEELGYRRDLFIEKMLKIYYPSIRPDCRLVEMSKNPPQTYAKEALGDLCCWQVARERDPFRNPVEIESAKSGHLDWMVSLITAGAPVNRDPSGLFGSLLAGALVASSNGSGHPIPAVKFYFKQISKKDPSLIPLFFSHPVPAVRGPADKPFFVALRNENWNAVIQLLTWGCPLNLSDRLGNSLPVVLMREVVGMGRAGTLPPLGLESLCLLLKKAEDDREVLGEIWDYRLPSRKPRDETDPIEFDLLEKSTTDALSVLGALVSSGCPLTRKDHRGTSFGLALVKKIHAEGTACSEVWKVFSERFKEEGDRSIPLALLNLDARTICRQTEEQKKHMLSMIVACELSDRLPSSLPSSSTKVRL